MKEIKEGKKILDREAVLFGTITNCENIKKVKVDYIGGGNGTYNLDLNDPSHDHSVIFIQ